MSQQTVVWKHEYWQLMLVPVLAVLAYLTFRDGLQHMATSWNADEYSHGFMLPFVALFLVWQRAATLRQMPFTGSWWGVALAAFGLFAFLAGELGTIYTVVQYGFLVTLGGLLLAFLGWRAFTVILPAYLLLFFMVPLPDFLYHNLSAQLQLISSELGVWLIRLFGISVFLEGNVIDLGNYQLQVVDACSGLRYLFPLTALGFIAAVIFKGALWKKVVLFLSTIPITILMNSFRIGVIGVLVEYWGIEMAEGFLHDFEGWIIFMACGALLVLEMWGLSRVGKDRRSLMDAFSLEGPGPLPAGAERRYRNIPRSFVAASLLLCSGAVVASVLPSRAEVIPDRRDFLFFPTEVGGWTGTKTHMGQKYLDALKLDDYLLADFRDPLAGSVNLYVAYYATQRKGASVHSPKTCLPGGGWRLQEFSQRRLEGVSIAGQPLRVNRALIQLGEERQLVYYWFQQRGRLMTNEYAVKWFLFWDALLKNRTDGALVRLTTSVGIGEDAVAADAVLELFARSTAGSLEPYIPR
ncbi:VPLPA-CTERM-specific exosortase XrtD [uncultured Thiohalocapsa sp.]|uniref:VPLPA-CTERM-specific exosortase XrtD n=1 Tax=uncultured Thiohalocapsa sp. TaxID=768990 RepID=UPI0025E1BE40|nr:VPLPA-CTERM-specific exosortase XrtD [uncultured Thiohalocapsa sp.]